MYLKVNYIIKYLRLGGPYRYLDQGHTFFEYGPRDLGRWITFWFFSYWDLEVSGKFISASNLCVLKKRVFMLFKARDRLQTKTKHYNMIFNF